MKEEKLRVQRWNSLNQHAPEVASRPSYTHSPACSSIYRLYQRDCASDAVGSDLHGKTSLLGYTRQICARGSNALPWHPSSGDSGTLRHRSHTGRLQLGGLDWDEMQPARLPAPRMTRNVVANAENFGGVQPHSCF